MTAVANGSSIANLVTTNNQPTTIGIALSSGSWAENGIQNGGLLNPSSALLGFFAIPTATEDYFYINQTYGTANATQTFLITGLNPNQSYNLSMFGTRNTATPRTTTYAVTDINGTHSTNLVVSGTAANSGSNSSDTQGNDKTIVTLNGLVPNGAGQLTFDLIVGDSQNYAYLGILFINPNPAPVFTMMPQSQTDRVGSTATLTAAAGSSLPLSYQWYFAGAPVTGATGTSLVLANVGYTNAGNYFVVASNSLGAVTSAVAVVSVVTAHVPAQALLIDFGPDGISNTDGAPTASPDVNGNYWNNMTNTANAAAITNLVTAGNTPTSVGVTLTSATWQDNGITHGGLVSPNAALLGDFAIPTATEDYFFIASSGTTATLTIGGLNPALTYNLSMFGTRTTSASDTRTSIYTVTDANGTHTVSLQTSGPGSGSAANPYGNDQTIVSLNGLAPNAAGQINLILSIGANTGNPYAYLGALEITTSVSAPVFSLNPQSQTDRAGTTGTLAALAAGSQSMNYQWYFASTNLPATFNPVAGATGANLVLANLDYPNAGSYYVVASDTLGSATSAVAVVTIVPLHVPAQSLLIDFGPDGVSNTDGARTLSPDLDGNYWNNMTNTANGSTITNLITAGDSATTVGVTLTSGTWADNGITHGGLSSPNAALLGDFAVSTATEDYFYIQTLGTTATLEITGLNPALTYNLSMFATRTTSATDTRTSIYTVTDVNGTHTVSLQTSGSGAGSAANPYGNDQTIVSLNALVPNAAGQLTFTLSIGANGGNAFAYVGAMEIAANGSAPAFTTDPESQTNAAGGTLTLDAAATSTLPVNYQWYFAGASQPATFNPVSGATSASLVLANLGSANAGSYYAVASNSLGSANSSVAMVTVTNYPPVAGNNTYSMVGQNTWRILVSDLLTNATDVYNYPLSLAAVGVSANGITLVITPASPAYVEYSSPNPADDQFSYTVTDGLGDTSSGVITLLAGSSAGLGGQISSVGFTGGVASMTFAGLPGYSYQVQVSTDLSNWTTIWTTNAPSSGVFQFSDNAAPMPTAFYRLMWDGQ
jgi:hypothetical protein